MDPNTNPFSPGAGSQPPELSGREHLLEDVAVTLERTLRGASSRSAIFVGLRGVGKTVLLNRVRELAEQAGFMTVTLEAREGTSLPALLVPPLRRILLRLNTAEQISHVARRGLRVLKSFAGNFKGKFSVGELDVELGVEPEHGSADSGNLEHDLGELMVSIADAARDRGQAVCLLIDELQYLSERDLGALIVALHQISQRRLPLLVYAAGLPIVLALVGRSKSYSERLFTFPQLGVLTPEAARRAIERPLAALDVAIQPAALEAILTHTGRYPYFLQQWGYEAWNTARHSPITRQDLERSTARAIAQLDESFFRVRFDRLTRREKEYMFAMMRVGGDSQRTGEVAAALGTRPSSLAPVRAKLIGKGMLYSPAYGENAFTVPLFREFLLRQLARDPGNAQLRLTP